MVKYNVIFFDGDEEFTEIVEAKNEKHLIDLFEAYYDPLEVVDYNEVKEETNVL